MTALILTLLPIAVILIMLIVFKKAADVSGIVGWTVLQEALNVLDTGGNEGGVGPNEVRAVLTRGQLVLSASRSRNTDECHEKVDNQKRRWPHGSPPRD